MKSLIMVSNTDWFFISHRLPIAIAAKEKGYKVTIIAPETGWGKKIEKHGFRFIPLPISRSGLNPYKDYKTYKFLKATYNELQPDLVHHITLKPVIYGSLAAKQAGVRCVVNAVSGLGHSFTGSRQFSVIPIIIRQLLKLAFKDLNQKLILQNESDLKYFLNSRLIEEETAVLIRGSGVDLNIFQYNVEKTSDPFTVCLPSRMLRSKGVGVYIDSIKIFKQINKTDVNFLLVGMVDPGNPDWIKPEQIKNWENQGLVKWLGHRSDMPKVLSESNLIVLPTYYGEGLPKVLLEAAAVGRAVITTDIPGCNEFVKHGSNGILIPPKNATALANAMQSLIDNPNLRKKMGLQARSDVKQHFTIESVIDNTIKLYHSLLQSSVV